MMTLKLKSYCEKTPAEFVAIMTANPRQNCVGGAECTAEDWVAFDNKQILEFFELGNRAAGTLREFSDITGEKEFIVKVGRTVFVIIREGDTFKVV